MSEVGSVVAWSSQFGLATAPLFEAGEHAPPGEHHVLLDGGYGSFAVSASAEELWRADGPAAWAWSSDTPHHVTITEGKVAVVRWDKPSEPRVFERPGVERNLDRFYAYLTDDRLRSNKSVIDHLLGFFRRVRSLSHAAGLPDELTTDVFTAALAQLIAPAEVERRPHDFGLADNGLELRARLDARGLAAAAAEIQRASGSLSLLQLHPALAVRHAGGQLFQEAHFELLRAPPSFDLFGLIGAPEVNPTGRGGTHFTPPSLARTILEQVLWAIPGLETRTELTVCDPACGSGAFLHEALRALRRAGFNGRLRLIGSDISAPAVAMARFVVAVSLRDWSPRGGVELNLTVGDSLGELGIPRADVIVMNPPFIGFGMQTETQREQLRAATNSTAARGDYSMAFVVRALEALADGGVLGTLFPSSLLSLKAAASWRDFLLEMGEIRLMGSIGDFGLFTHAMVQVACAVIRKGTAPRGGEFSAVVTENDPLATSAALRQLRKLGGVTPLNAVTEKGWNLFPVPLAALKSRPTWRLATPSTERMLRALSEAQLPTVNDLFEVAQGVQTGLNEALLLTEDEWRALPTHERGLFRRATMSDSIQNGQVEKPYRLFFPYTLGGSMFQSEEELRRAAPTYFSRYLLTHKERLASRASIVRAQRTDWWGLMHPRSWSFSENPRIISKFFGDEGSFIGDYAAEFLPVMGHIWIPKPILIEADGDAGDLPTTDILAAYVALFNSTPFVKLLSQYSPHVAGGQFDLSSRHVAPIPVPNLRDFSVDPERGRAVSELAAQGRKIDLTDTSWRTRTIQIVTGLYGVGDFDDI